MILPNKHIVPRNSLLGASALLLKRLEQPMTVSELWRYSKERKEIANYQRFVLALDLLYILGAVELCDGLLSRSKA